MIPANFGFRMPAEWDKHSRTFMAWPVREAMWPGPFEEICEAYAGLVKSIAAFEQVILIVSPSLESEAVKYCGDAAQIEVIDHDDSWMRDNGPTFVKNAKGEVAGINWVFNAWGGKYPCKKDNLVAPRLLEKFGVPRFDAPIVMEGGSIHVDGEGTVLTTEQCLLHKSRNPQLQKSEVENALKQYIGAQRVIWLKRGWDGDDTDGHVDNVACFARPGVVLVQVCSDPKDPNYEISQENLAILRKAADARERSLKIITVEQPRITYYERMRLTLSYLNFYFVNGGIILPVFGGDCADTDQRAVKVFKETFPDRKIVTINGATLARGGGNVHCLTQQMPEGVPALLDGGA